MFIHEKFVFNNIDCSEYGIIVVRPDSNSIETPWGVNRSIIEEKIPSNPIAFFMGVEEIPLTIKINIAKVDGKKWNGKERREIISWLFLKNYAPLISYDDPDIAYYVLINNDVTRVDFGLESGYVELQFRSLAPYGYSYPKSDIYYPSSIIHNNIHNSIITIENKSNILDYYYPKLRFEMLDAGDLTIQNLTVKGETFKFTGLQQGEIIYIDNESRYIESSLQSQGIFRRGNFNKSYLRLTRGKNRLKITGNANLSFVSFQVPMSAS